MQEKSKKILKKRDKLIEELKSRKNFIRGNLTQLKREGKSTNSYQLTYKDKQQKTHTKYISIKELLKTKKAIKDYNTVKQIMDKISKLNIELIKSCEYDTFKIIDKEE